MRISHEKYKFNSLKRVNPLFFLKECEVCKDRVAFESMWRFTEPGNYWFIKRYICCKCAQTKENALNYLNENYEYNPSNNTWSKYKV